ncbi:MAG TPA: hypothetical protein VGD53_17950 [Actinoallomurus sp.]
MRRGGPIALGCALLLVLTGCRLTSGRHDQSGPPAGGWPQPAGTRVTSAMCGLLTDADYARLGHDRKPSTSGTVRDQTNTVDCLYESVDEMTLSLEPTAAAAKYIFAADLRNHRKQLAEGSRRSDLAGGVVGPADESWFDNWSAGTSGSSPAAHEIRVRRGGLILGITLSGDRGKKERDPRTVLVDLADLVLRRLPHVGARDTGTTHRIEYELIGKGKATGVYWDDYTGIENSDVENLPLPWSTVVEMASPAGVTPDPPVLHAEVGPNAKLTCLIFVDGVPVAGEKSHKGVVECEGVLPDDGDAGGDAQPA